MQEKLELQDFNIVQAAQGVDKVVVREFKAVVRNKTLDIRFHWAGKGTTAAPEGGTYGPLISAISVKAGELCALYIYGDVFVFFLSLLSYLSLRFLVCLACSALCVNK